MDSVIIFCAKYLFVLVVVITLVVWVQADKKDRTKLALTIVLAALLAVVLDKIANKLYYNPRPFVVDNIKPLVAHLADNGFPSEHTVFLANLSAVVIFFRRRLGILCFALTLVVGIGRVAAHVHSPIDILAGAIIGIAAGAGGYWLAQYILKNYFSSKTKATKQKINTST